MSSVLKCVSSCDVEFVRSVFLVVQLTVKLKDVCSMTKEKTARLIPNAIQLCTDSEKVPTTHDQLNMSVMNSVI